MKHSCPSGYVLCFLCNSGTQTDGHFVFITDQGAIFQKRKFLIELEEIIFM